MLTEAICGNSAKTLKEKYVIRAESKYDVKKTKGKLSYRFCVQNQIWYVIQFLTLF